MAEDEKGKPPVVTDQVTQRKDALTSEAGALIMKSNMQVDASGSLISDDRSFVLLQDKFKSLIQFIGGSVTIIAASDLSLLAGGNVFVETRNDAQFLYGNSKHEYIRGDASIQIGQQNPKQRAAAKKLQQLTKQIDQAKMDTIKQTEGEEIPCEVCAQRLLSDKVSNITDGWLSYFRNWFPRMALPLDTLQYYLNLLVAPFISTSSNLSMNGGEGCDSPGCKNGKIKSPITKIQAGNEKAAQVYEQNKEAIQKAQKEAGEGGSFVLESAGDVVFKIGTEKNDSPTTSPVGHGATAFKLKKPAKKGELMCVSSAGTAETVLHSDPLINPGSLVFDVANKATFNAGSPGFEWNTSGKGVINAAVATIASTEGELTLTSANKTTIKGKNILIDAKDRSGDTGLRIESDNTMVAGLLNVTGDFGLKGSIMMDGTLHCTHLHVPSERISTSPGGGAHWAHSNATWNDGAPTKATALNAYDKAFKVATRDVAGFLMGLNLSVDYITTIAEETYATIMLNVPLDNFAQPTGIAMAHWWTGPTPIVPVGPPLQIVGYCAAGPVHGYVIPGQIQPIYNYQHVHNSPGQSHVHDTTVPAFDGYDSPAASRAATPQPSHVPTPAKAKGMGQSPGHKSMGSISSCGGGGGAFVNPKVSNYKANRNTKYGITGNGNGFTGNFVNARPGQNNYSFNPDGSLNPPPDFTGLDC
jgi:hypothetical protein